MASSPDPSGNGAGWRGGAGAAPPWVSVPVLLSVAAIAGALVPGVLLAAVGWFRPGVAGLAMSTGAGLAVWASWPSVWPPPGRSATTTTAAHVAAGLALVGICALSLLNISRSGQWVLTDRDPGVVVTAAGWLAEEGRLDAPAAPGAFSSVDWASGSTAQGWAEDGERVQPQFMHGAPVALATARWIGGDQAMLHVTALFALLAGLCLFVLAARLMPPWAAAGAAVSLVALAPQAFVARAAFSEVPAQLLLLGAAALLLGAVESRSRRALVAAGVVATAVVLVRIDGALALAGLGPWLAARALGARGTSGGRPGQETAWIGAGVVAVAGVAVVEAIGPASAYVSFHRSEIVSQLLVTAAVWGVCIVVHQVLVRRRVGPAKPMAALGDAVAALVVVSIAGLWWIRPLVETTRESAALGHVGVLQAAAGLPVDGTRRYFEDSLRWFAWYLGPAGLALAAAGLAGAVRRCGAGRDRDHRLLLVVGLAALPTAVFVWRARTTPDQLWVMRRFVPATLPLLMATAWGAIAAAGALVARWWPRPAVSAAVSAAAAAALVVPLAGVSWPLRDMTFQAGALDSVDATCDALGPDAAVLVLADEGSALILPATLRFACGVPAVGATRSVTTEEVGRLAERWTADGRRLFVVSATAGGVSGVAGDGAVQEFRADNERQPVATIASPPARLRPLGVGWAIAPVP